MANGEKADGEIHEIIVCPFRKSRTLAPDSRDGCFKAGQDMDLTGGHQFVNLTCVGEENCPDMQTHRAIMKILATLEAVNKVL